ncbi:MAG: hypothetical protein GY714_09075 [Desulfobacterales bacterium]|nr:hypothetical protein [Desulfobacterales bacterium]
MNNKLQYYCQLLFLITLGIGFVFEESFTDTFPEYTFIMHFSLYIFILGVMYSIILRNFMVFIMTTGCSLVLPYLQNWWFLYWPY